MQMTLDMLDIAVGATNDIGSPGIYIYDDFLSTTRFLGTPQRTLNDERRNLYLFFVIVTTAPGLLAQEDFVRESPAPGNLRFTWIHGSISAKANTDVRIQVHATMSTPTYFVKIPQFTGKRHSCIC